MKTLVTRIPAKYDPEFECSKGSVVFDHDIRQLFPTSGTYSIFSEETMQVARVFLQREFGAGMVHAEVCNQLSRLFELGVQFYPPEP